MVQVSSKFVNLKFNHRKPESFVRSQCQTQQRSALFLTFRWILALFFIGGISYTWTNNFIDGTFAYWWIYMTNWGLFICTISTFYAASLTTYYHVKKLELSTESLSYKILWWLTNVATVMAFMITLVYWIVLFEGTTSVIDVWIHAGNSLAMLLEIIVAEYTFRVFHFIYPIFVGIIYLIFTLIYYFAGGVTSTGNSNIYPILNWGEKPLSTGLVVLGVAILLVFVHLIAVIIQLVRKRIGKKYFDSDTLQISTISGNGNIPMVAVAVAEWNSMWSNPKFKLRI